MKVARGRSWQPEIGMEHASRGRRSGNKGVGARWRGRFRIFSARHCSRTKVSHAENSGMTMLFFSWRLLRCRRGILSHARERPGTHAAAGAAARGIRGEELGEALLPFVLRACCGGMCWPVDRPATHAAAGAAARGVRGGLFHTHGSGQTRMPPQSDGMRGFLVWGILSHAQERRHEGLFFGRAGDPEDNQADDGQGEGDF